MAAYFIKRMGAKVSDDTKSPESCKVRKSNPGDICTNKNKSSRVYNICLYLNLCSEITESLQCVGTKTFFGAVISCQQLSAVRVP